MEGHVTWQDGFFEQHVTKSAGGFFTRVPVAAMALSRGGGFTLAERVFMAASWVPKVPGSRV